ncbi:MAG: threonine synthase [Ignavibacteriaceae bacterium]|nr:threonine synthase [Ignavibacteriaceae bacterium]
MKYYSTNNRKSLVSFREAIFNGLAQDGGLYMPERIIDFSNQLNDIFKLPLWQKAAKILYPYTSEILQSDFEKICYDCFNFPASVQKFNDNLNILELYKGPTLAFKDFGARFLAGILSHYLVQEDTNCTILVATSGDTGSAVANAFWNKPNINVVLLYPSGMVSELQEKQLTTLGGNVTALEIEGTFDDCQLLVKSSFSDKDLREKINITSANSINIARLLPQSLYYFEAFSQITEALPVNFIVPSGNLGNLTSGLFAKFMGLPVNKFIAALNSNKVFKDFIDTGNFNPTSTIKTISNAMDVGNPSNFYRIYDLFSGEITTLKNSILSFTYNDADTKEAIICFYEKYGFIIDPHTAIGFLAYLNLDNKENFSNIILSTAHYGKFFNVIEELIPQSEIKLPIELEKLKNLQKMSIKIKPDYNIFKKILTQ